MVTLYGLAETLLDQSYIIKSRPPPIFLRFRSSHTTFVINAPTANLPDASLRILVFTEHVVLEAAQSPADNRE